MLKFSSGLLFLMIPFVAILLDGCAHASTASRERDSERSESVDERSKRGATESGTIVVEPLEGAGDTVTFHIGSPLFLRLRMQGDRGCEPFNGQFFYFDASDTQLG